jgi:hypothetical protein
MGYNPVIDVEWQSLNIQINKILNNIESYQTLVDRNYELAVKNSSWASRVEYMNKCLQENGYNCQL